MKALIIGAALAMSFFPYAVSAGTEAEEEETAKLQQAAIVAAEITAFTNQLSHRPETAFDFSKVSGEYCFYAGWDKVSGWDKHHTHYAIDPTKTQEDVIDYVDARPLLEAGVNVEDLPRLPGELGKMIPGQWYFRPADAFDPHHGEGYDYPELVRASDLE